MAILLKASSPLILGLCITGFTGANIIFGSNKLMLIDKSNIKEWNKRVGLLPKKLRSREGIVLRKEITETIGYNDGLKPAGVGKGMGFDSVDKARLALQAWCEKDSSTNKMLTDELCKNNKSIGWIF